MANSKQITTNKEVVNRKPFIDNTEKINNFVMDYVSQSGGLKTPNYTQIAEGTGLHYNTVKNHYKTLKFKPLDMPQRSLTPEVINNLYSQTLKSPSAAKLWFQIMEGWTERMEVQTDMVINVNLPDNLINE